MTNALGFDALKAILCQHIYQLPDHRQAGPNARYTMKDAALGAFGIFYTQSPSFLAYQNYLQQAKGANNACTLFGVEQIPCNDHVRNRLDPLRPSHLNGVSLEVVEGLKHHGLLNNFRMLSDQLLVALDGTQYYSSQAVHCHNCLRRQTAKGHTLYYHSAITPVIVSPERAEVIALPPEFIMPQDGHDKQDCERVAGKRWIDQHAKHVAPHGVTLLGDDLYSNQPLCKLALQNGFNFIFVCKPDSHAALYERLAFWQDTGAIKEVESRRRSGRVTEALMYRYLNEVLLRSGKGALSVNWLESTSVHANTGEQLYHNSFITNHHLTDDNVADIARAGRGRWKIENENNNVLKTKGYHIEHNFGHGKQYLAAFLLSLNLLAFLFHTVLEWCDEKYALLRKTLTRRQTFFDDIRALTRYMVFASWPHLMDFMIRGLELEDKLEAQIDTG
jgi:Transposase DDE domain